MSVVGLVGVFVYETVVAEKAPTPTPTSPAPTRTPGPLIHARGPRVNRRVPVTTGRAVLLDGPREVHSVKSPEEPEGKSPSSPPSKEKTPTETGPILFAKIERRTRNLGTMIKEGPPLVQRTRTFGTGAYRDQIPSSYSTLRHHLLPTVEVPRTRPRT